MTYRTDDDRKLLTDFIRWLNTDDGDLRITISPVVVDKFLAERKQEREWKAKPALNTPARINGSQVVALVGDLNRDDGLNSQSADSPKAHRRG